MWCAMPKEEIQNYIAQYFTRFADITDYVEHDQYFSGLNKANHIWYNAVVIQVTSFQCDEQAIHTFHCTWSTWWRYHTSPGDNKVLYWMRSSLDRQFHWTAESITARLKCEFVVEDSKSQVQGLLALVKTFARGRYIRLLAR